jgi:heme oxygenase
MTNILGQILPNHQEVTALHLAIEKKPYLMRYIGKESSELTLVDHYRHLRQLKAIYDTFSALMNSSTFTPQLPENLAALLQRGSNIQHDLDFLSPHVTADNKDDILESTQQYADHLRQIPLEAGSTNNNELLINFLVSILGDLNGGQFLKTYVKRMYERNGIFSKDAPDNGVRFYSFEKGTATNLTEWLKTFITFHNEQAEEQAEYDEDAKLLGKGAVDAFTMQSAIVDELEQTRLGAPALKKSEASVAKNNSAFFSCNNIWKAAAATTASVAVGLVLAATLT